MRTPYGVETMSRGYFGLISTALLALWPGTLARGEEAVLDVKTLQSAWAKSAPAPNTCFRFEFHLRRTRHAEGTNAVNKDVLGESKSGSPLTDDKTFDTPVELIIRDRSVRWTRQSEDSNDVTWRHTTVSHGGKSTTLHEPISHAGSRPPDARIEKEDAPELFQQLEFYPITFAISPVGKITFIDENLGSFQLVGKRQLLGRDCWLFKYGSFQFYFDAQEPYVLRKVTNASGAVHADLQIEEYKVINNRLFPAVWTCSTWYESKRYETTMYQLMSVSDQSDCPDSTFALELPLGTHVSDGSNNEQLYVVTPPSKEGLTQRLVIAGVLVVIVAVIAVWQIRRWRRGLGAAQ